LARLKWGSIGTKFYEAGVDQGVLYVDGLTGVAWSGLVSVTENPTGGNATPYYIDGVKHLNLPGPEEFEATIEAFTYPQEFTECEGLSSPYTGLFISAQSKRSFGLSYRTRIGNDQDGVDHGYKIHIVYNAFAEPASRSNKTIGSSLDASNFSWKITTRAPAVVGFKRTAHFIVDSRYTDPVALLAIENILYGDTGGSARLPTTSELLGAFLDNSSFVVVDNGDGSWTATGTALEVIDNGDGTFVINAPGAVFVDSETYTLSSP
jgi:hypothetical protein